MIGLSFLLSMPFHLLYNGRATHTLRTAHNVHHGNIMDKDRIFSILQEEHDMAPREIASRLGIPPTTVYSWVHRRQVPAYRVGRNLWINPRDLRLVLQEYSDNNAA